MNQAHALIIDDNAKNLSVLARLLAEEQVGSTQVTNPRQLSAAIETLDAVDVVFLDLELPNTNGYEILAMLHEDDRFADVPIVAYTVHVSEINAAQQRGFHSFLGKPIDPDKFHDQLARILSGEAVWETV